jgi:hypothetical protein
MTDHPLIRPYSPPELPAPGTPRRGSVTTPIRRCLGVTRTPQAGAADELVLVLQRADGALHCLSMDYATAAAAMLALRCEITAVETP